MNVVFVFFFVFLFVCVPTLLCNTDFGSSRKVNDDDDGVGEFLFHI